MTTSPSMVKMVTYQTYANSPGTNGVTIVNTPLVLRFNLEILGRVLGPAKGEGSDMAQWILKANGRVVPRRNAVPLSITQMKSETEDKKRTMFDQLISKRWVTSLSPPNVTNDTNPENLLDPYEYSD